MRFNNYKISHTRNANFFALQKSLENLGDNYNEFLKQKFVEQEVQILKNTVKDCLNGSPEAKDYLIEHGNDIIHEVKEKLESAVAEQTRLYQFSQLLGGYNSAKAFKASRASYEARKAAENIEGVIETIRE